MVNFRHLITCLLVCTTVAGCAATPRDKQSQNNPNALRHTAAPRLVPVTQDLQIEDYASALSTNEIAALSQTEDPLQLLVIGKSALKESNFALAEAALRKSSILSPTIIDAHLFLGNLYFLTDRFQDSRSEYQKALTLEPQNIVARNNMMLIDLRQAQLSIRSLKNTLSFGNKADTELDKLESAILAYLNPSTPLGSTSDSSDLSTTPKPMTDESSTPINSSIE